MKNPIVTSIIRHGLTSIGGILAANGYANNNEIEQAVSALMVLIGVGWSVVEKIRNRAH